ncbi:acyl-[acyl-carrier-protein]--UDP-N-acetylglucosamine O-acyltransferase [Kineobactrum sediminis]|uniref:Acyl-[acyl-carrier-protein]--UDP-N-acetylglucosamine O-acyltransferase n=1 Tax=Kineobactrum sediminis TaxID=1905677 RepID=A0A2N5Y1J6_9GAMM|nr:acyl-ACP--UDP-N-acetylglucosamine O-acyltransferase [Kineobactrum sediminis]PLW82263.1 acyl-[acyl-carrier-protein]--UDP-N-acetylglucosamine O-acyltransferase [Kineobactrum sediminis]
MDGQLNNRKEHGVLLHPTAIIDASAQLDSDVVVGPYAIVGPQVEIGAGTRIASHVVILGHTRIGRDNSIHAHACLGDAPQDLAYTEEPTRLELGDNNTIREFVTIHRGSARSDGVTRVGDRGLFMVHSHIAHDCQIGNHVVLANGATLGGHVSVGDRAIVGGLAGIHQFVRIGAQAMVGACSMVTQDLPPFVTAAGSRASLRGLNSRGLQRAGMSADRRRTLKQAYRLLFRSGLRLAEACHEVREQGLTSVDVLQLLAFLEQESTRGILR